MSDENKKQDMELLKKLDERRQKLEDLLLQKLEELKAECICEGVIFFLIKTKKKFKFRN